MPKEVKNCEWLCAYYYHEELMRDIRRELKTFRKQYPNAKNTPRIAELKFFVIRNGVQDEALMEDYLGSFKRNISGTSYFMRWWSKYHHVPKVFLQAFNFCLSKIGFKAWEPEQSKTTRYLHNGEPVVWVIGKRRG